MFKMLLSGAVLVCLAATAAEAAAPGKKGGGKQGNGGDADFRQRDANRDGKLSFKEFAGRPKTPVAMKQAQDAFRERDKNDDAFLTPEEFRSGKLPVPPFDPGKKGGGKKKGGGGNKKPPGKKAK